LTLERAAKGYGEEIKGLKDQETKRRKDQTCKKLEGEKLEGKKRKLQSSVVRWQRSENGGRKAGVRWQSF